LAPPRIPGILKTGPSTPAFEAESDIRCWFRIERQCNWHQSAPPAPEKVVGLVLQILMRDLAGGFRAEFAPAGAALAEHL